MTKLIENLADRALSVVVPKSEAWAYKAGCTNLCSFTQGCSDWECCLIGGRTPFWQRTCPRSSNPANGCYLEFSGKC